MSHSSSKHWMCIVFGILLLNICLSLPTTKGTVKSSKRAKGEEGNFFEGDIQILDLHSHEIGKRMVQDMPMEGSGLDSIDTNKISGNLWPNGIVHYKIDSGMDDYLRSRFSDAMNELSTKTCLEFKPLSRDDHSIKAYLNLTDKLSCSSYVGRIGKMQEVSITLACKKIGHAIHELGHAIGFFHEHTRLDRDEYVQILWENIKDDYDNNFKLYLHHNSTRHIQYDFSSVMHYPLDAFAKRRGLKTIVVKDTVKLPTCVKKIGQRASLSYKDQLRINTMYNCKEKQEELIRQGDPCPLPPPIVAPSTVLPKPTPTPTSTPAPTETPCKRVKAIATDDIISITLTDNKGTDNIICSGSSCFRKDCSDWKSDCYSTKSYMIYMTKNRKNPLIKSGYEVVLRDTYRNQWVDCSRKDGCRLTDCDRSPIGKITNYTKETCSIHHLSLFASGKKNNKRIQTQDLFYIKANNEEKYLNCYGKSCKLITEGSNDCISEEESSGSSSGSDCTRSYFKIHREVEICEQ